MHSFLDCDLSHFGSDSPSVAIRKSFRSGGIFDIFAVFCVHWEKYWFVMTILDPTENYFHIENKRILLITIKQVITSERSERIPC